MQGDVAAAAQAVRTRLGQLGWNMTDLAREAGVDFTTVREFLAGERVPQLRTRARLEAALRWAPGSIEGVAKGRELHVVEVYRDDASYGPEDADRRFFISYSAETSDEKLEAVRALLNRVMDERAREQQQPQS